VAQQGPVQIDTVIIGAGHAGLAMSRCLSDRGIDHVVLERADVANSWRTERWDSLRLLTPNWQSKLPGFSYQGNDPDGFMAVPEIINFVEHYADVISAPIDNQTTVTSVRGAGDGYQVDTDRGSWRSRTVVIATGACNIANVPAISASAPSTIDMVTSMDYRNSAQLRKGGVLVVGASATGIQLADEIHRSGRPVTLSAGEHVRMPRVYRGRDIFWWMDAAGVLDERYDEVDDINRARNVPSPQLVGSQNRSTLDLNALTGAGVNIIGRLAGINDGKAQFSGSLRNNCALADLKMNRLLNTIDEWVSENSLDNEVEPPHRFAPTVVEDSPPLGLDIRNGQIETIVWATGFHSDYSWLDVPVLDRKGKIRHDGGVVNSPGMYLMGMTFLRRRKSSFIHGAGDDASDLSDHLAAYLANGASLPKS
jgi:putative flavoprotein involved in K+ transport